MLFNNHASDVPAADKPIALHEGPSLRNTRLLRLSQSCLITAGLFLSACGTKSDTKKKSEAVEATDVTLELTEDANRPRKPLLESNAGLQKVVVWRPLSRSSVWTIKGDAIFYAAQGAEVDFVTKTVQFMTKEEFKGEVLGEPIVLSDAAWAGWLEAFGAMNKVELTDLTINCSTNRLQARDWLSLRFSDRNVDVINYRTADCEAELIDTLSFKRIFDWLDRNGAPWAK